LCSCSWKHSRWCAFIWMLCADVRESRPLAAARRPSGEKSIVAVAGGLALLCYCNGVLVVLEMSNEAVRRCQVARKQ
jgi:hypothetical protein